MRTSGEEDWIKEFAAANPDRDITYEKLDVGYAEDVMNRANKVGTIRTYLGRKCRFDLYEPSWYDPGVFHKALPLKQAQAEYGGQIKRAGTYKALNRLKDGTYGYCEETGEPIGIKRLIARPVATLSIEAQERHERDEKIFVDD